MVTASSTAAAPVPGAKEGAVDAVALPPAVWEGLAAVEHHLVGRCFESRHYDKICNVLPDRWDRFHNLSAAMKLLEAHGAMLLPQEEVSLQKLDELQLVLTLAQKTPCKSKEQFNPFHLQLRLIVATALRVEQALQEGRADVVALAMDDAERVGIAPLIVQMCLVQAGSTLTSLRSQHKAWVEETAVRLQGIVRSTSAAEQAKAKLTQAQATRAAKEASHRTSVSKALEIRARAEATAVRIACLSCWSALAKRGRKEVEISADFRATVDKVENQLCRTKAAQRDSVHKMVAKKAVALERQYLLEAFHALRGEWVRALDAKRGFSQDQVCELEARLARCRAAQAEKVRKVVDRMAASAMAELVREAWEAWGDVVAHRRQRCQREADAKAAQAKAELEARESLKARSAKARRILERVADAGRMTLAYAALHVWMLYCREEQEQASIAEMRRGASQKSAALGSLIALKSSTVVECVARQTHQMLCHRVFGIWRLEIRMEILFKQYSRRIDTKRSQLAVVQNLFRSFAVQLESGLDNGSESERSVVLGPPAPHGPRGRRPGRSPSSSAEDLCDSPLPARTR